MSGKLKAKVWYSVRGTTKIEAALTISQLAHVLALFEDIEMDDGAGGSMVRKDLERTYGITTRSMKKAVPHRVNEKPSEWISKRTRELCDQTRAIAERNGSELSATLLSQAQHAATLEYLDAHAPKEVKE